MKKRAKKTYSIHHWLGLVAGLFLLISSLTGSVLVFHHDIDHVQFKQLSSLTSPASELKIDNSFERIRQANPESDIRVPELPENSNQALKYEIRKGSSRKWLFVHPETGETLATVDRADKRLVHVLLDLHYNLLSGTPGKIIVLLGGLALIVLTITGFLLYRKSILKVLSFRQLVSFKSRRSFFSSLHRVVGVWSLVFNLFISITGTWIAYTIVEYALSPASSAVAEVKPAVVSVDEVIRQVKADYPEFKVNYLRFAGGTLSVLGRHQNDPAYYGRTYSNIQVDLTTGEVKSVNMLRDQPWHQRLLTISKPIHFGDYAGIWVKLLYSFFGMLPGILAVSGFVIWRLRKIKPAPKAPRLKVAKAYTSPA
ncbi:PepSY-associated TM helix domain-containing protein [Pontibacter cellulosilyticus]|uniref:PepSY domain-containing protein n=1 Tax=Pontibacter cellulosilyticus TaxID=1720253 RepID=A0A923SK50_9BACT|nr:PepSY-associated TM helix domain-containing protein [Pontibacter cellulosilyticus]MBC5994569.1 PepSY domain-containing protein [Pontibacter cellulosilyticus]